MASKSPKKTPAKKTTTPAKKKVAPAPSVTVETPDTDSAKITLLAESNPKREGSAAHGRFALYKSGMTVSEYLAAGGTRSDLRWDAARNFVRID